MKILALSDQVMEHLYSPAIKENYGDVDLVLGCGDLPYYYLEYVVTMLNVPLYYVPGNHDPAPAPPALIPAWVDNPWREAQTAKRGAEGCTNIDGAVVYEQGLILAGLGGSIRYRPDGAHQYTQAQMHSRALALAPRLWWNRLRYGRSLDILIAHSPPLGIHDDTDPAHIGFAAFNRLIAFFHPRYLLHGHAHLYRQDAVTATRLGDTTVMNVYPCRVVEMEP